MDICDTSDVVCKVKDTCVQSMEDMGAQACLDMYDIEEELPLNRSKLHAMSHRHKKAKSSMVNCHGGVYVQFGGYESDRKEGMNEEGLEGLHDLFEDVAASDIIDVFGNMEVFMQKEELKESGVKHEENHLESGSQVESFCLDSHVDHVFPNVDEMMNTSPNVCLKSVDVLDGINGLLDSEESDSCDKSMREGLIADDRPRDPFECVRVVILLDMDRQLLVSKDSSKVTSQGSLETNEGEVGCVHLDVIAHCDQHVELRDDHGFDEIDPELDAILNDALDDFMTYDRFPLAHTSAIIGNSQLAREEEIMPVPCKSDDGVDVEWDAILDDALMDFGHFGKAMIRETCDLPMLVELPFDGFGNVITKAKEKLGEREHENAANKGVGMTHPIVIDTQETMKLVGNGLSEIYTSLYVENPMISCVNEEMRGTKCCSHVLLHGLLTVAMKKVMHVKWALLEAFFGQCFSQGKVKCNPLSNEPKHEGVQLRHRCQQSWVFNPSGFDWSLFVLNWATSFWHFDPGG